MEGEGSFRYRVRTPHVSAVQVQREPLDRLQLLLGGKIYWRLTKGNGIFVWECYGALGASVMMTLYPMLSPRRKAQVAGALAQWKKRRTLRAEYARRKAATHCKRGHAFTLENTYVYPRGVRSCKTCMTMHNKARRLRLRVVNGHTL